ncbi:MAG: hypothetical protein M3R52_01990 [Acidobacteriota bacterium]|nr:hypothetical protein [Acidobacteriota bacterium]
MKKEILKGFAMLMLLVALALATAVVSANAQSSAKVMSNIPFEFVVGDKTLPAGEYSVAPATAAGNALMIQNADNGKAAIRLTDPTEQMKNNTHARLVFHRYGKSYFLAEVWNGESVGRQIVKSRQERAIERELASIPSKSELAQSTYETITVVAVRR